MKTSNKLLLAASLLIFGNLAFYDFELKAEYVKGDYKSRFYGMESTTLNSFNRIENQAGNVISLRIEEGPKFAVWMNNLVRDKVAVKVKNNILYVDYKNRTRFNNYVPGIIITCPAVNSVTTSSITESDRSWGSAATTVTGFTQDVMNISASSAVQIELNKNALGTLNAGTTNSKATLIIHGDNQINTASFNIIGKSELKLFSIIPNSNYNYTDSAAISLNGKVMRQIQKR